MPALSATLKHLTPLYHRTLLQNSHSPAHMIISENLEVERFSFLGQSLGIRKKSISGMIMNKKE